MDVFDHFSLAISSLLRTRSVLNETHPFLREYDLVVYLFTLLWRYAKLKLLRNFFIPYAYTSLFNNHCQLLENRDQINTIHTLLFLKTQSHHLQQVTHFHSFAVLHQESDHWMSISPHLLLGTPRAFQTALEASTMLWGHGG